MKSIYRYLAMVACSAFLMGCVGKSHDTSKEMAYNPPPAVEASQRGQAIYEKYCLDCHGEEGKGDGPRSKSGEVNAADLTKTDLHVTNYGLLMIMDYPHYSADAIQRQVAQGGETMPALKKVLNEEQIQDVTAYVKTLIYE